MNYLEVGLAHTEMIPKKTFFQPERFIPMSGLGRRYMGLDRLPENELNKLCDRLSQPRTTSMTNITRATPQKKASKRFGGAKRMTANNISDMVSRLYSARSERVPDSKRVLSEDVKKNCGVTSSYLWNGQKLAKDLHTPAPTSLHHSKSFVQNSRHVSSGLATEKNCLHFRDREM